MGLLQGTTPQQYYQGNEFGKYQFTSLDDIIEYFMVAYVGEDKIIPKIKKLDVAFFAQRALQELSFDTFKSVKAQEIVVPATLQMILPQDYVNYTKISWVDSAGIKHLLYPTSNTSNPFSILQDDDGNYSFPTSDTLGVNMDFEDPLIAPWQKSTTSITNDTITVPNGVLTFKQHGHNSWGRNLSKIYTVWQELDTTEIIKITLSAKGTAQGSATKITDGDLKIGITNIDPSTYNPQSYDTAYSGSSVVSPSLNVPWLSTSDGNNAYHQWINGETDVTKELSQEEIIDVSTYDKVYVVITSVINFNMNASTYDSSIVGTNTLDDIKVVNVSGSSDLVALNSTGNSTTWDSYKSATPSESEDDYQDDTYWPLDGERYGLNPQHAQVNGSFFIDQRLGKIHFSSNISGKTVILDYISDSLGTNEEMQVHKFAEDAMYKWIAHAILSTSSYGQALVPRLTKEKFAAVKKAKLRLSNLKLEELTQILRGKSKQIKH